MIRGIEVLNTEQKDYSQFDKWEVYLCSVGSREEYKQILEKNRNAVFAVMEYRRLLRNRGFSKIFFTTLNTAYIQRNYSKLYVLLQELFLEYISKPQFNYILEKIDSTENGLKKLYDRHQQNKELRILSIVKTL